MFNEKTIKDIETIDILVSKKTKELFDQDSNLFLSWTFSTNHQHSNPSNYFVVWVGQTGGQTLKQVCFASVNKIPDLISEISEEKLKDIIGYN